jgi:hypothetical protein
MTGGYHPFPVTVISSGGELLSAQKPGAEVVLYDTLFSINVIEHVQDVFEYLTGLYLALKPHGLLIFHDRYYSHNEITNGDVYHPIRIKKKVGNNSLSFSPSLSLVFAILIMTALGFGSFSVWLRYYLQQLFGGL